MTTVTEHTVQYKRCIVTLGYCKILRKMKNCDIFYMLILMVIYVLS